MKAMKKALALGLALAMVVTAVPVTNAQAASTGLPKSKNYYAGKTYTLKLTTPSSWKSVKTKWSEKSSAVSLSSKKAKSVKVKAIKKGSATVKATVTYKKSSKSYKKSYSCKVTVKDPVLTAAEAATIAVGEKVGVKATGVKPASATVEYSVLDSTIATVDAATGEVTGVKAGTTKVTAKLTCGTTVKEVTTDVTVKDVVFKSVEQTESKVLIATIVGDGSKVTAKDVVITNTDNKVINPVKKVSVDSKDKTKLVIEAYNSMTDGKTYSVKYDDKELTFVASDGKVNDLTVDPVVIDENTLTEINLVPVDVNGVKLDKIAFSNAPVKYEFNIDVTKGTGYTSGKQLLLSKAGDEATATVKYTPGTVDVNGVQTGVIGPKKIVITAQTPEAITVGNFKMAIGDAGKKFADAKVDATLAKGDTTKAAFFEIKNSKNKEISGDEYLTYTVESSDTNVLILGSSKLGTKHEVKLVPVAEGTAYIVLKDKDGNAKGTFPVTVSAERKIASLTLDKSSATVYTGTALNTVDVALTVKDQYTDKVTTITNANVSVECVSVADGGNKTAANTNASNDYFTIAGDGSKVTFKTGATVVAGTYTYTIKVSKDKVNLQQNVTIKIAPAKTSGTKTDYELAFSDNTVDVAFDKKAATINTAKNVTIQVIKKIDGVPSEVVSAASIKVTMPDGTSKPISSGTATGLVQFDNEAKTNTFAAIEVAGQVATQAAIGTYKFEIVPVGSTEKLTRSLTITNSSTDKLTAVPLATTVNKTDASISDIEDLLTKNIRYTYAGKNYEGSGASANGADYAVTVTGFKVILSDGTTKELKVDGTGNGALADSLAAISSVSIQNVTIQVTLKNETETSYVNFNQTVNIGQTITLQ